MTTTVTVTSGQGAASAPMLAFDGVAAVAVTGLAAAYYSAAVTGRLTTPDGHTALADDATWTVDGAGAVTLTFDTDTAAMLEYCGPGRTGQYNALLTVYVTSTKNYACRAVMPLRVAARAGVTI